MARAAGLPIRSKPAPLPWKFNLVAKLALAVWAWLLSQMWMICANPCLAHHHRTSVAGLDVIACEPNLSDHPTIRLHELEQVLSKADLLVFLVAHIPLRAWTSVAAPF